MEQEVIDTGVRMGYGGAYRGARARIAKESIHLDSEMEDETKKREKNDPVQTYEELEALAERKKKQSGHGYVISGADLAVKRCVVWADNATARGRADVALILRRLVEVGSEIIFTSSSDEAAKRVAEGGVDLLVTNLGRSRPDSGLLLIEKLKSMGYGGPSYVYSKSAMEDKSLKKECFERGALKVFGGPEEAIETITATLHNPTFARWERPPPLLGRGSDSSTKGVTAVNAPGGSPGSGTVRMVKGHANPWRL